MSGFATSVVVAQNPHEEDGDAVIDGHVALAQADTSYELIVVDNGGRPAARSQWLGRASEFPPGRMRIVETRRPGRAAANNVGARAARAEILLFFADDFLPSRTLARAHREFHRHVGRDAVGIGPAYFTPSCRSDPFPRWLEDSGKLFGVAFRNAALHWPRDFFYAGNASLTRRLFDTLGGFDETFEYDLVDDLEFGMRLHGAGVPTHLLPKAVAWHDHVVTIAARSVAMHRSGAAAARLEQRRPAHRPWAAVADLSPDALVAQIEATAPSSQASGHDSFLFGVLMNLAFVQGYRGLPLALPDAVGCS